MTARLVAVLVSLIVVFGAVLVRPETTRVISSAELRATLTATEQRVVTLVNQERANAGLAPLSVSAPLTASARGYASYMASANFFDHNGPDGSNLVSRDQAAGYGAYAFLAENLAAGQSTPESAMAGWMASPGHRSNILSAQAKEIGVGYFAGGRYGHYWVQEFGTKPGAPRQAAAATAPAPAPQPAPLAPSSRGSREASWTSQTTGHTVSGEWLGFLKQNGDVDNLGYPRTDVLADPLMGGQTVQYFQRLVLEYHPENPAAYRIQRRLLADILYPGADEPVGKDQAPPGPSQYFPFSSERPTGLGHYVADYTLDGQPTYFKEYFDSHGGVSAFGYPKEEPKFQNGRWTQRFQAAIFESHPENDRDGVLPGTNVQYRNFRVQLALLGDEYIARNGLPFH